jgi:hypothetical protein
MESATYSEARTEYQKQMANKLVGPLLAFFRKLRSDLFAESSSQILSRFQQKCSEVPKWNQDVVAEETNRLIDVSRCDYLEELMTALFIAHTKVMASIRIQKKNKKNKKLTITVPKLDHFLHRVFTECAKSFWKAPFLFSEDMPAIERQKNLLQAERVIEDSIYAAVRDMLPIKEILQEYITDPNEETDDEGEEEMKMPSPVTEKVKIPEPVITEVESVLHVKEVQKVEPEPIVLPIESVKPVKPMKPVKPSVSESIKIDTEPTVQFSEMVSVFDERTPHVSEMRSIDNPMNKTEEELAEAAAAKENDDKDNEDSEDSGGSGDSGDNEDSGDNGDSGDSGYSGYSEDNGYSGDNKLLHIGQEVGGLGLDDVEDIEHPGQATEETIGEFETLE